LNIGVFDLVRDIQSTMLWPTRKGTIFLTYAKVRLKYTLMARLLGRKRKEEDIFGFKVSFFNYETFLRLFREIFVRRSYYFSSNAQAPVIIDCGSNIGMAVLFFKLIYPKSKIIAFEPDSDTFQILSKNIRSNNLSDVEIFDKALSSSEGRVNFYYSSSTQGSLKMSLDPNRLSNPASRMVETVKLSSYISSSVDFVKLDVEGSELAVIEDLAKNSKLDLVKEMIVEYHHHVEKQRDNMSELLRILEEGGMGYQIETAGRIAPIVDGGKGRFQDLIIYVYNKRAAGEFGS
jgi:FkbM family methyltransferase